MDLTRTAGNQEDDQNLHRVPKNEKEAMFPTDGPSSRIKSINDSSIRSLWHRPHGPFFGTNEDKSETKGVNRHLYVLSDTLCPLRISLQSGHKFSE